MREELFPDPSHIFEQHGYVWGKGLEALAHISSVIRKPEELERWLRAEGVYYSADPDMRIVETSRTTSGMLAIAYGAFYNPLVVDGKVRISKPIFYTQWKLNILEVFECPYYILEDFAADRSSKVRARVASMHGLSLKAVKFLISDGDPLVREALLNNLTVSENMRIMAALS